MAHRELGAPSRYVLLSGLGEVVAAARVRAALSDYGEVQVRMLPTGRPGHCEVEFPSVEVAQAFVECSVGDFVLDGAAVAIEYSAARRGGERERERGRSYRSRSRSPPARGSRYRDLDRDGGEEEWRERDFGRIEEARYRPMPPRAAPDRLVAAKLPNIRDDWMCDSCKQINFARRQECFTCKKARPAQPDFVAPGVLEQRAGVEQHGPEAPVLVIKAS